MEAVCIVRLRDRSSEPKDLHQSRRDTDWDDGWVWVFTVWVSWELAFDGACALGFVERERRKVAVLALLDREIRSRGCANVFIVTMVNVVVRLGRESTRSANRARGK